MSPLDHIVARSGQNLVSMRYGNQTQRMGRKVRAKVVRQSSLTAPPSLPSARLGSCRKRSTMKSGTDDTCMVDEIVEEG